MSAVLVAAATRTLEYRGALASDIPAVLRALRACGALPANGANVDQCHSEAFLRAEVQRSAAQKFLVVYDEDALKSTFAAVRAAFPPHFVHALAMKSAPLAFALDAAVEAGLGLECASFGEAAHAVERGCPPRHVVFDSPAKTLPELRWALACGLTVNADSLEELVRIEAVQAERRAANVPPSTSTIGLRVNPIISGGAVPIFAVSSSPECKFGHPLHSIEAREAVLDAFARWPWLHGLHCHVGSAGTSLEMLARGARALCDLADEIDAAHRGREGGSDGAARVQWLDIGGGLACSTGKEDVTPTFSEYAQALAAAAPALFERRERTVFTEFGRALTSKSGWIVSQVEYAKQVVTGAVEAAESPPRVAILHAGADVLLRACYRPDLYVHRLCAYDANGEPLDGDPTRPTRVHDIAGPLCFAGDYVRRGVLLPHLEAGDWLVVLDAGANTLALWSRHCSRLAPPVWSYARDPQDGKLAVRQRLDAEPLARLLQFWGTTS